MNLRSMFLSCVVFLLACMGPLQALSIPVKSTETKTPVISACGQSNLANQKNAPAQGTQKVIDGVDAVPHSWPWVVAIMNANSNKVFCGGVLVSDRFVLTTYGCCKNLWLPSVAVRLGAHNFENQAEGAIDIPVISNRYYPNAWQDYFTTTTSGGGGNTFSSWQDSTTFYRNDFCLLETATVVNFTRNIAPICLGSNPNSQDAPLHECYLAGWGAVSNKGDDVTQSSPVLKQTALTIDRNNQTRCVPGFTGIKKDILCATGRNMPCGKDNGSGLFCYDYAAQHYKLYGLHSFGRCGRYSGQGDMFARTSIAENWINEIIGGSN